MNPLLMEEHLMLGAQLAPDKDGRQRVERYGAPSEEEQAPSRGAGLVDLGGMRMWRFSGAAARPFAEAAFAGRKLSYGSCAFEAVLIGDGSVASLPLLARTGEAEYACFDASSRAELLGAWLGFLSSVEQDGVRPYAELALDDEGEALAPLLLMGAEAPRVLGDYLAHGTQLPDVGEVRDLTLDRLQALVVALPLGDHPAYLVLVGPSRVRVLWRSLLSFPSVIPMGEKALWRHLSKHHAWTRELAEGSDKLWVSRSELAEAGLVRAEGDYVGARGLAEQND